MQKDPSNAIRLAVKEYADDNELDFYQVKDWSGYLRNLVIRNTSIGEWMVIVVFNYEDQEKREGILNHIAEKFPEITFDAGDVVSEL